MYLSKQHHLNSQVFTITDGKINGLTLLVAIIINTTSYTLGKDCYFLRKLSYLYYIHINADET